MSDNDDDFMCDEDEEYDLVSIFFKVIHMLRSRWRKNKRKTEKKKSPAGQQAKRNFRGIFPRRRSKSRIAKQNIEIQIKYFEIP